MKYILLHDSGETVEFEAMTETRKNALAKSLCYERNWRLDETQIIPVADDSLLNKPLPYWKQKELERKQARDVR
jgi:hypothetical protein